MKKSILVMVSILSSFSPMVFAVQGSDDPAQQTKKVVGLVRIENGKASCVKTLEGFGFIQNEVSDCSDEESTKVLAMAQSGLSTKTAWVSHAAFAGIGCVLGLGAAMGGMSLESWLSSDNRGTYVGATSGPGVIGTVGTLTMYAAGEPTGHVLAGLAGIAMCGGGWNYLLYSERNR